MPTGSGCALKRGIAQLTNEEYQKRTKDFAIYSTEEGDAMVYLILGLASEAGEVAGKLAKLVRGDYAGTDMTAWQEGVDKEMGDCLWMISQYCNETGTSIGALMEMNIGKLENRKSRGRLQGEGDAR